MTAAVVQLRPRAERDGFVGARDGFAAHAAGETDSTERAAFPMRNGREMHTADNPSKPAKRLDSVCSRREERNQVCRELARSFVGVQPQEHALVRLSLTRPQGASAPIVQDMRTMIAAMGPAVVGAWLVQDERRRAGGAHAYGVVIVPDRGDGGRSVGREVRRWWEGHTGASHEGTRSAVVSGGDEFALGAPELLVVNLTRVIGYGTKALPNGRRRELAREVVVSGVLAPPWADFVSSGRAGSLVPVEAVCAHCGAPIAPGRRGQKRRFCASGQREGTSKCRTAAQRERARDASRVGGTTKPSRSARAASAPSPPPRKVGKP